MKIIKPSYTIMDEFCGTAVLKKIERIGRLCYKSENAITENSHLDFVRMLISRGHEAMIEHFSFSVLFTVDRGVTHEIVRHRLASFAQESTRYCNYSKGKHGNEITVIETPFWEEDSAEYKAWEMSCLTAEAQYIALTKQMGGLAQEARAILPNSTKADIVMTANLRSWRNFFKLRTAKDAHPQMREVTIPLLEELQNRLPVVFEDIKITDDARKLRRK